MQGSRPRISVQYVVGTSNGRRKILAFFSLVLCIVLGYTYNYRSALLSDIDRLPSLIAFDARLRNASQHYTCSNHGGIATFNSRTFEGLHSIFTNFLPHSNRYIESSRKQCWYLGFNQDTKTNGTIVCIPKVFLAGFPKCGSTQLYQMILQSEDVVGGYKKELHWWTRNISNDTTQMYLKCFSEATNFLKFNPNALIIEGSQSTIWETRYTRNICDIPRLMSHFLPDAKYILIMREPVSRLYSDFLYFCYNRGNFNSARAEFHQFTKAEIAKFNDCTSHYTLSTCVRNSTHDSVTKEKCRGVRLGIGVYYDHIRRWLEYVPRQQFLFLRTEDMGKDPYGSVQQVWKFLNVKQKPKKSLASLLYSQINKNPHNDMLPETKEILTSFYKVYNKMLTVILNDTRYMWNDN